ncbi:hypothetical protein SERN_0902 [Serinibacter arcticus]|uniref:Uncharacterized protein n=1 Tax=Serinibacter arcticus TaxID=1655435 RepID=A0A4Z1E5W1_9MICO|nr:hypothetical protein SERN_0902 [Serinibacter arcticus]
MPGAGGPVAGEQVSHRFSSQKSLVFVKSAFSASSPVARRLGQDITEGHRRHGWTGVSPDVRSPPRPGVTRVGGRCSDGATDERHRPLPREGRRS